MIDLSILRCPASGGPLEWGERDGAPVLISREAGLVFEVRDGVPILLAHEAQPLT